MLCIKVIICVLEILILCAKVTTKEIYMLAWAAGSFISNYAFMRVMHVNNSMLVNIEGNCWLLLTYSEYYTFSYEIQY